MIKYFTYRHYHEKLLKKRNYTKMKKILKILITSIIVIIISLTVWTFSVITYQKHKSEKIIDHVIERKGWDKKIKNEKMSFNIMKIGRASCRERVYVLV